MARRLVTVVVVGACVGLGAAGAQSAQAGWKFTTLKANVPGVLTTVALNDDGLALTSFAVKKPQSTIGAWAGAGYFDAFNYCGAGGNTSPTAFSGDGWDVGKCWNDTTANGYLHASSGAVTYIQYPGAYESVPEGVNNGVVAGYEWQQTNNGLVPHGFLYYIASNTYQQIDPAASVYTVVSGFNAANIMWGWYNDSNNAAHGFTYQGGLFTVLPTPAGYRYVMVSGVNDSGQVAGIASDEQGFSHAFVWQNGNYTWLVPPDVLYSEALAINDAGQIAGTYVNNAGTVFGFRWTPLADSVSYFSGPAGNTGLAVNAINSSGQVAGVSYKGSRQTAFVAACTGKHCD